MKQELSLKYVFRERTTAGADEKSPLLLLLHGFGSNEADLIGFAPYFDRRFFVASARAPHTTGYGGFAWFEMQFAPDRVLIDPAQVEQTREVLLKFVDELVEKHNLDADRVFLAGFSQGAIMIYTLILSEPEKFAGAVTMSGSLAAERLSVVADAERLRDFPILVTHGKHDTVLPIEHGRAARDFLARLPVKLDYREYPKAHHVTDESLRDVISWLFEKVEGKI